MQQLQPAGEPSLQNSLELALKSLRLLPSHASKEILIVIGALTTCDPGDVNETIQVCATVHAITRVIIVQLFVMILEYEIRQY